jgi:predicted nuclease with TOPRIM domain
LAHEEYNVLKQQIAQLQDINNIMLEDIKELTADSTLARGIIDSLQKENRVLNEKNAALDISVSRLQNSEKDIKGLIDRLTEKIPAGSDLQLITLVDKLKQLYANTHVDNQLINERLISLESSLKLAPVSGIFTYIDKKEDQLLFMEKVKEALLQEMTYAQIDHYLTKSLPFELNKIIKDHPTLTKNYIRNLRRV